MRMQSEYHRDQKYAALCELALWSDSTWSDAARCPLFSEAAIQWILHHRLSTEMHKTTVAGLIGSVRGVIPNSKLAKYGDYSYNFDYEDMYYTVEDSVNVTRCIYPKDTKWNISNQYDSSTYNVANQVKLRQTKRWLKKVGIALEGARRIVDENKICDFEGTDALLKLCLRFIFVAYTNDALLDVLNTEITFVSDYEEIWKLPISRIELQSIPRPHVESDCNLDCGTIDALWVKLASTEIRKLWKTNDDVPFFVKNVYKDPLLPLMKINFLRRHRKLDGVPAASENVDITKDVEIQLLGSLFDEAKETSGGNFPNHFPEAHGQWTRKDFPYHVERNAIALGHHPAADSILRMEHCKGPMPFYRLVPPPNLVRLSPPPPIPSPYMSCTPRSGGAMFHNMAPNPMGQQATVAYIPPTVQISTPPRVQYWDPLRLPAMQGSATEPWMKMNVPRFNFQHYHSEEVAERSKYHTEMNEKILYWENIAPQSKGERCTIQDKCKLENGEAGIRLPRRHFEQFAHRRAKLSSRIIHNNLVPIGNPMYQPVIYENHVPLASNVNYVKPNNPHVQASGAQSKINNPVMNYRLTPSGIHSILTPRNPPTTTTQFRPRFGEATTLHDVKHQMPNEIHLQRLKYNKFNEHLDIQKSTFIGHFSFANENETKMNPRDKVEKELETVNVCLRKGSFFRFDELTETRQRSGKLDFVTKAKNAKVETKHFAGNDDIQMLLSGSKLHGKCNVKGARSSDKYRSKSHRSSPQLKSSESPVVKLRKVKYLKGTGLTNKVFARRPIEDGKLEYEKHKSSQSSGHKRTNRERSAVKSCCTTVRRIKRSTSNYFDDLKRMEEASHYKMLVRENRNFNSFPSKRRKIMRSEFPFFDDEMWWSEKEGATALASLNYQVTDELFFSAGREKSKANAETTNGWSHFEMIVNSVLKNVISSLNERNLIVATN